MIKVYNALRCYFIIRLKPGSQRAPLLNVLFQSSLIVYESIVSKYLVRKKNRAKFETTFNGMAQ